MKRLFSFWVLHWLATVAGWYTLSALAQGAADSVVPPSVPLVVFNAAIQVLSFPLLLAATALTPALGNFGFVSFGLFALIAALNSALVVWAARLLVRAVRGRDRHDLQGTGRRADKR